MSHNHRFAYWLAGFVLLAAVCAPPLRASNPTIVVAQPVIPGQEAWGALPNVSAIFLSGHGAATPAPTTPPPSPAPTVVPTASPTPTMAPAAQPTPAAVPSPTAPAPTRNGKVVFLDPGHGGADSGAVHTSAAGLVDLREKDINLGVALRLAELLRGAGYQVIMARDMDRSLVPGAVVRPDVQARVDMANQAGADLFVSIHHNGQNDRSMSGVEVYYCSERPFSFQDKRLAWLTKQALVRNLRQAGYAAVDRGTKDDAFMGHFAVLAPANLDRAAQMPGIIGEALFMTNDADAAQLRKPEIRQAIAQGYFEGIQAYFGY